MAELEKPDMIFEQRSKGAFSGLPGCNFKGKKREKVITGEKIFGGSGF